MGQKQDQAIRQVPYVYIRPADEVIAVATVYDPSEESGSVIDANGIGKRLKDLTILADGECTIEFWDYIDGAYRTAEKIKSGIAAIWDNELIGKHRITPSGASSTLEIHRGSAFP